MSPLLERLAAFERSRSSTSDALTNRQQEVVETAYTMGDYEVAWTASTEDVAKEVELDSSTVAGHLQQVERNAVSQIVESPR